LDDAHGLLRVASERLLGRQDLSAYIEITRR
jgi:hypothetical protein